MFTGLAFAACTAILIKTWALPSPGDISDALSKNPDVYTLALGHMLDLTLSSFAYLRLPLFVAALAFLVGTVALWRFSEARMYLAVAVMLVLFFQAARLALIVFDPYLSSFAIARELNALPPANLIFNGQYYDFSSIPFYTSRQPLLLNGRVNNLEYGSYAPGSPRVFIGDKDFVRIWSQPKRAFVVTYDEERRHLEALVGVDKLRLVMSSGGKELLANIQYANPGD